MPFRILTGRTRRLMPRVIDEMGAALSTLQEPDARLLLLVPEQATLQAELLLCDRLQLPGFFQMEVLSPSRLCDRVFALAGSPKQARIDARGKQMALRGILRHPPAKLTYYESVAGRRGFVEKLSAQLAEVKRAGLAPGALTQAALGIEDPALAAKLRDMDTVYGAYEALIAGQFVDGEDVQRELLERMPQSGLFTHTQVWVAEFDAFSNQFLQQLLCMGRLAQSVTLAMTLEDETARDAALYAPAREQLTRIARMLDEAHMPWQHVVVEGELPALPAIRHLEKELFAHPVRPFQGESRAVTLHAAADPYEEALHAAAFIRDCARYGIPFGEMAVVHGDLEGCGEMVAQTFRRADIPAYVDRKRPALAHPLIQALLSALRVAARSYRQEDVRDWLKSGFCGLTENEAALLENYVLANGIRGNLWLSPFTRGGEQARLAAEALRGRFMTPLEALRTGLREAGDATASATAIFRLLEDVNAYARLDAWQRQLMDMGHATEAADCAQVWHILLETLEQLHALQRGKRIPLSAAQELLEAGFSGAELGGLPPTAQAVQIGRLGHAKLNDIQVLLVLGFQDGALSAVSEGLLADDELQQAETAAGVSLGLRAEALERMAQVKLLDTFASAGKRLRLSFSLSDARGAALRPAPVLRLLTRALPGVTVTGGVTGALGGRLPAALHAPGTALDALGPIVQQAGDAPLPSPYREAMAWLLAQKDWQGYAQGVMAARHTRVSAETLPIRLTQRLYARARQSVTRLETFAQCPYRQYVEYGLRPKPREVFEIAPKDTGTFYHAAMEAFLTRAGQCGEWPGFAREACDALCNEAIAPLLQALQDGPMGDTAKMRSLARRFGRVARRAAWTITCQLRGSAFMPVASEVRFGGGGPLPPITLLSPDGETTLLEGRIDRVDLFRERKDLFLRVVDYKSGGASLDPTRLYHGLQLQLMLYLSAALGLYPGAEPAGAFYFHVDEPIVSVDERIKETVEKEIAKELRLAGIVLGDVRIAGAMGASPGETIKGWPFTKDASLRKDAFAPNQAEMRALIRHAERLAGEMAQAIREGNIAIRPAEVGKQRACRYCEYRTVCGFDPRLPGASPNKLDKVEKAALLAEAMGQSTASKP